MTAQAVQTADTAAPVRHAAVHDRAWPWCVGALATIAAVLTIWASGPGGVVDYYAAAAVSMSRTWPNFLWGALDPAGTLTVDKIPGALWAPALAVRVFGYSPAAVLAPAAAAAVGAVIVGAVTARRLAGIAAGVISGAALATTPILVAVSRTNQPESYFVLTMTLAAWAAVHALERRSVRWLCAAGCFIALGFQVYMALAWAIWPALAAAYACTRQPRSRRVLHVLVAGAASTALSLSWVFAAVVVPAADRPYLGSTIHDNPWEMVFGYDGAGRFVSSSGAYRSYAPPFAGGPSPLRLFTAPLAGQIAWLLPAAVCAVAVLVALRAPVWQPVLLGGWMLTFGVLLSTVSGMHEFYTAALAVPFALALGAAFGRAHRARSRGLQAALTVVCAVTAIVIADRYHGPSVPVAAVQSLVAVIAAAALLHGPRIASDGARRARGPAVCAGVTAAVAGMLLTPAVWSVATLGGVSAGDPVGGGALSDMPISQAAAVTPVGRPAAVATAHASTAASILSTSPSGDRALMRYVSLHARRGGRYTLAVFGADRAATLIVHSDGRSVLPIGGYSQADPTPTLDAFTAMVQAGDVRYVQLPQAGADMPPTASSARRILTWVTEDCRIDMHAPEPDVYDCARG